MKRSYLIVILALFFIGAVGFTPDPGSYFAEYKRLPLKTRIERLQKSGEDLFLRRRYEDAIKVFDTILALRENDLKANLWKSKVNQEIIKERNDALKDELYTKYNGYLIPEDKIYGNWKWDPSIGHFEVRYSEPKPYVRPVRKVRPYASTKDIEKAKDKAKSGKKEDLFEVAMLYWSRKDRENALEYFHKAYGVSPEILMYDDEMMLITIISDIEAKEEKGTASPQDLYEVGRLQLIQGDRAMGISSLVKAGMLDRSKLASVKEIISSFIETSQVGLVTSIPVFYSFRQGYVFEKAGDYLYLHLNFLPRNEEQIVSLDFNFPFSLIDNIESLTNDCLFAYAKEAVDGATSLWFVLKEASQEDIFGDGYELKIKLKLNREEVATFELSNYALQDIDDNWSFVIGKDVNLYGIHDGENETNEKGMRISGHHLPLYGGRGPYINFLDFTEPLEDNVNIWKLMEPKPYELNFDEEYEGQDEEGYVPPPPPLPVDLYMGDLDIGL